MEQSLRISLTVDTWTSDHDMNYIVLTAHFIDVNWRMQKKILNFCPIESLDGGRDYWKRSSILFDEMVY